MSRFISGVALCLGLALATPAFAQAANQAAKPAPAVADTVKPKRAPTAKQLAAREHMKACGAEWRDMKAKGTAKDMTWRTFSKSCLSKKG